MKFRLSIRLTAATLAVATAVSLSSCGDKEIDTTAAPATPETPAAPAPATPDANAPLPLGAIKNWDDAKAHLGSAKDYKGDKDKMLAAIEAVQGGADINKTAVDDKDNLLGVACDKNDYDLAAFLISQGADVAASPDVKRPATPFARAFSAAGIRDYKLAEALLTSGLVQPNQMGADQTPLLNMAARSRILPLAKLLVEKGADVNLAGESGRTALFESLRIFGIAVGTDPNNVARFLLEHGAKTDVVDKEGRTILMYCAPWLDLEMIEVLVAKGADLKAVDAKGKGYAMYLCASGNKVQVLERLKALGDRVDVVTPDQNGMNTIYVAANDMKPKEAAPLIQYLIERGADPKATWTTTGVTCLHNSVTAFKDKTPEIVEVLIKAGADVNAEAKGGKNAAMYCISLNGSTMNLDFLLKNGTDVTAKDNKGQGLWDYAEKYTKPGYDYKKVLEDNNVPKP